MIIYTNQRSKKKKQPVSQKLLAAQAAHRKFLTSMGVSPAKRGKMRGSNSNWSDLTIESNAAPLSNTIPGSGAKRSLDDYKWRKDVQDNPEAIAEAEKKKTRIAPYTNKGAYMYLTDDADTKSLGRKV